MSGKSYAQFSEDLKLVALLGSSPGVCVEVGANDGITGSNSYLFEQLGWTCVLVEPNPSLCEAIRSRRRAILHECAVSDAEGDITLHVVEGSEGAHGMSTASSDAADLDRFRTLGFQSKDIVVRCTTLDRVLESSAITPPISFVSIDVEGLELAVLRGFSLARWRPRILLIEDNSANSDRTIEAYLSRLGYARFHRTGVNDWYAAATDRALVNLRSAARVKALVTLIPLVRWVNRHPPAPGVRAVLRRIPGLARLRRLAPF